MPKMTARVSFKDDTGHIDEWRDCEFIPRVDEIVYIGTPRKNWRIIEIIRTDQYNIEAVVYPHGPFRYWDAVQKRLGNR